MQNKQNIVIIGGGWSGLSAAIELCEDHNITLLEAAPNLGGRARGIKFNDTYIDNGQHLLLGAYDNFLSLANKIGVKEDLFYQAPLELNITDHNNPHKYINLNFKSKLSPIFNSNGLNIQDKISLIKFFLNLKNINLNLTAQQFCERLNLSQNLQNYIIEPICLASMTTGYNIACMQTFANLLTASFKNKSSCKIMLPKVNLSKIFPDPAEKYLLKHNVKIYKLKRANDLLSIQQEHNPDKIILSTPYWVTQKLLASINANNYYQNTINKLNNINPEPITTIYLQYEKHIQLPKVMHGLINSTAQWVFDKKVCNQDGLIAVIISGKHNFSSNLELLTTVQQELSKVFNLPSKILASKIITEKRAAFSARPGISSNINQKLSENMYLAGDYLLTNYPATLETAVLSGIKVANLIKN